MKNWLRRVLRWVLHPYREMRRVWRQRQKRRVDAMRLIFAELARLDAEAEAWERRNPGHNPYI